jgi:hypothetical protein
MVTNIVFLYMNIIYDITNFKTCDMDTKTMISGILDIMYNIGTLDFWYDRILKLTFNQNKNEYVIVLLNKKEHKVKTLHLSNDEVIKYIMNYDF